MRVMSCSASLLCERLFRPPATSTLLTVSYSSGVELYLPSLAMSTSSNLEELAEEWQAAPSSCMQILEALHLSTDDAVTTISSQQEALIAALKKGEGDEWHAWLSLLDGGAQLYGALGNWAAPAAQPDQSDAQLRQWQRLSSFAFVDLARECWKAAAPDLRHKHVSRA